MRSQICLVLKKFFIVRLCKVLRKSL